MARHLSRFLALFAALAVLGSAGCGDDEEEAGTKSAPGATAQRGDDAAGAPATEEAGEADKREGGSKAAAPGVPTSKQGDNSIQTWGLEAGSEKREQAAAIVQAYLRARAERDWEEACSYLAEKPRREQEKFAGGASCAEAMETFASRASDATLAREADTTVLSFRVGGGYAFLIYRRPDGIYAMPLVPEDGTWRLFLVTANPVD